MQVFKNLKIIGIDHGYGNIKTANTVTPTGVSVFETEPTFEGNVLFYDGKYYRFGEGHKPFISDKTEDEDFYTATLLGIAKELSREKIYEADVHIAAGLPLTWVKNQRESFREYLMKNPDVTFRYKKNFYKIHIAGCSIYPQGYAAVIGKLGEMSGVNMLADIGNGTINIMYINNRKPVESKCWTEKLGVNQCMISVQNAVLDTFGARIDETIIENIIRYGKANIGKKYLDCITEQVRIYAEKVLDVLEKYEYNSELMRLYITGGGVSIIKNFAELDFENVVLIEDICAAAKGYETICLQSLRSDK
ncbi:MAG: ParM/StbA family protein [Oscillospiraceae bacterium]|nr:ParM/StbA family protein [Oscillospiraceae bacterium]